MTAIAVFYACVNQLTFARSGSGDQSASLQLTAAAGRTPSASWFTRPTCVALRPAWPPGTKRQPSSRAAFFCLCEPAHLALIRGALFQQCNPARGGTDAELCAKEYRAPSQYGRRVRSLWID